MNMPYLVLVCGGGPHFSGNFMQSYIFNNLRITNVSDNIIFARLYDVPTKIGTQKVISKHYMFNICSYNT